MKTFLYSVLTFASVLLLGVGCSKEEEPPVHPERTGPIIPKSDPTAGFDRAIHHGLTIDDWAPEREELPELYYTYFTFCNASSHTVYTEWSVLPMSGRGYGSYLLPGEQHTQGFANEVWGPFTDKLMGFHEFGYIQSFYDQPTGIHYRTAIYDDYMSDFKKHYDAPNPSDECYWYYEEFDDHCCRWTYIFTDADYDRAVIATANRKYDPDWCD